VTGPGQVLESEALHIITANAISNPRYAENVAGREVDRDIDQASLMLCVHVEVLEVAHGPSAAGLVSFWAKSTMRINPTGTTTRPAADTFDQQRDHSNQLPHLNGRPRSLYPSGLDGQRRTPLILTRRVSESGSPVD